MNKAELQEAYDNLLAANAARDDLLIAVAARAAVDHDLCEELENILKNDLGIDIPDVEVTYGRTVASIYRVPFIEAHRLGIIKGADLSDAEVASNVADWVDDEWGSASECLKNTHISTGTAIVDRVI